MNDVPKMEVVLPNGEIQQRVIDRYAPENEFCPLKDNIVEIKLPVPKLYRGENFIRAIDGKCHIVEDKL